MASAAKLCKIAVGQLGTSEHPPGSNIQKYGAEYGMNGVAWCAIFVWWCFKHAGLKCPYGKCAYVPTCATKMSKLHKGGAGQAKPGDIRIVKGQGHIGICVQSGGGVVAGNSGDKVSRESAGGTYYRPKCFGPDIVPIKFNNKTYYYNPETKKVCTDKNGKNPIQEMGSVSGAGGGNTSGNLKSGTSSSNSNTYVYKEYYKTKPQTFDIPKDVVKITSAQDVELTKSIRITQLTKDINNLLKKYPKNSDLQTILNNIKNVYDCKPNTLINYYNKLADFLKKKLIPYTGQENGLCLAISGDNSQLRYAYKTQYSKLNNDSSFKYYNLMSDDWIELFNDITLKRDAIKYYIETSKDYNSPLLSKEYREKRLEETTKAYNKQLISLQKQMEDFKESNIDNYSMGNKLKELNEDISNAEISLANVEKELLYNYTEDSEIKNKLNNYKTLKENVLNQKDKLYQNYFSNKYNYWNKNIIDNPEQLNFWLEFLINHKYSIKNIGLRAYATTDSNVKMIYAREIPQVIYYSDNNIIKNKTGFNYLYIKDINDTFKRSSQGLSAKSVIDEVLYQHSICSEEINLTIIPIHYLEPNTRIFVYNEKTKINNEYIINKITKQLAYNGTMNISATKVVDKLY